MDLHEKCKLLLKNWAKSYNASWADGVIYARFSQGGKQTDQSIEGQIDVNKKFADDNHINVVNIFFDQHITGTNDKRENFQRMLALSKNASWSFVIVYDIERFGRNKDEIATNRRLLRSNQKIVLTSTQINSYNIDGSRNISGIIMESVHEGMAEYYSVELSLKVKRGQRSNLEKKAYLGGAVPFGYKLETCKIDNVDKKRLIIDAERAAIVREIYRLYLDGKTIESIRLYLQNQGIINQFGRKFSKHQIITILQSERYVGKFSFAGRIYENYQPAIITKREYDRVQERFRRNKQNSGGGKAIEPYLLTTKLVCGCCGANMLGESGKSRTLPNGEKTAYHYYKCYGTKNKSGCDMPTMPKDAIENFVVNKTIEKVFKQTDLTALAHELYLTNQQDQTTHNKLNILQQELTNTEKSIKNILKAIEDGLYSNTTKERLLELESEKERLKNALAYEQQQIENELPENAILFYLEKMANADTTSIEYRQRIIETFIAKVILYKDKVVIIYRFNDDGGKMDIDYDELKKYIGNDERGDNLAKSVYSPVPPTKKPALCRLFCLGLDVK